MLRRYIASKLSKKKSATALAYDRALKFSCDAQQASTEHVAIEKNHLERFFDERTSGPGIWKWRHYFEAYHRHLKKFRGKEVKLLEIGIYSGGSLDMWRDYFGPSLKLYGCDIESSCRKYESEDTRVFIGDQADREFWKGVRAEVPYVDVVIDDGGHTPEQQMVTIEETLSWIAPGGVYICEDIHGTTNEVHGFIGGLVSRLNQFDDLAEDHENPGRRLVSTSSEFQRCVHSLHFYPYLMVIEKHLSVEEEFVAPKHGDVWEGFLG